MQKAGFIQNLPFSEYLQIDAISSHGLMDVLQSPAHYKARKEEIRVTTPAMEFGTLLHSAILEPQRFLDSYIVQPDFGDLRTKAGKEAKLAWQDTLKDYNIVVTAENAQKIVTIINKVHQHPVAANLFKNGASEVVGRWQDTRGVDCKMRADFIKDGIIIDLKTTRNAHPSSFQRDAYNFKYDVQTAFYLEGFEIITGEIGQYIIVAVESESPHEISVFAPDQAFIEIGQKRFRKALDLYADCKARNVWPGYSQEIQSLALPNYAFFNEN